MKQKAKREAEKIKREVIEKVAALVTAAFGFVAALAWNEAIKNAIIQLGLEKYGPLFYAIIVTVIAVVAAIWIGRIKGKINGEECKTN